MGLVILWCLGVLGVVTGVPLIREGVYFTDPTLVNLVSERHDLTLTLNMSEAIVHIERLRATILRVAGMGPHTHPFYKQYHEQLLSWFAPLTPKNLIFVHSWKQ